MKEIFFLIVIIICMFGTAVFYHEMIHGAVCEAVGGTPKYSVDIISAKTDCEYKNPQINDMEKYNIINEMIGYNLLVILVVLILYPMYLKILKKQ